MSQREVEIRHATEDDLPSIIDLLLRVFGPSPRWPESAFRLFYEVGPAYTPYQSVVAVAAGDVVSHVAVRPRRLRCSPGGILPVGGISSVATNPEWRGRGLATVLLREAIDTMKTMALPASMLFTGIPGFYARLGWTSHVMHSLDVTMKQVKGCSGLTVRDVDRERDAAAVEQVCEESHRQLAGAEARPTGWAASHLSWTWPRDNDCYLLAESNGCPFATVRWLMTDQAWILLDAAHLPGRGDAYADLMAAVCRRAERVPVLRLHAGISPHHPLKQVLLENAETAKVADGGGTMLRINDLAALLDSQLTAMEERLRTAAVPPGYSVAIGVGDDEYVLDYDGGKLRHTHRNPDERIVLSPAQFWRLLFGGEDEALANQQQLPARARQFLSTAFPVCDSVYWDFDHF